MHRKGVPLPRARVKRWSLTPPAGKKSARAFLPPHILPAVFGLTGRPTAGVTGHKGSVTPFRCRCRSNAAADSAFFCRRGGARPRARPACRRRAAFRKGGVLSKVLRCKAADFIRDFSTIEFAIFKNSAILVVAPSATGRHAPPLAFTACTGLDLRQKGGAAGFPHLSQF